MAEDEHILPCPISYIRRNVKTPKQQDTCLADIDSTVSDWVHSPWSLWFWASSGACEWPPSDLYFPMTCRKAGKGLKLEKTGTHFWENGVHGYRLNSFRLGPQPMVPLVLCLIWGMCGPHGPLFPDDVAEKPERVQSRRKQGPTAGRMGLMGRLAHLAQLSYLSSIDNLPFALISSIHSWAPTTPCPSHWQLPRRTTCITTAGDGGGNLKDLGTDKSPLMLFVPERASYGKEINAVQKIYRDDAVYCQYRSWTFLCLDIDLPFSPPSFSHTTWLVSTKRHTATTKCPYLYPIRES
ncbi:hypothetical protein NC651_007613 [Populus alba x Populus x berolinensis]|nr:hypothetical protein NC651_007613 [Populus alba x Populus x berolinensis]